MNELVGGVIVVYVTKWMCGMGHCSSIGGDDRYVSERNRNLNDEDTYLYE